MSKRTTAREKEKELADWCLRAICTVAALQGFFMGGLNNE